MSKLIIVGQIPPPFHGQSVMIKAMADGLEGRLDCEVVPMRFSREVDENGDFGIRKVVHLLQLIGRVRHLLKKNPGSTLYYPPAPPKWSTVLRDWLILSCVRPLAGKVIFHFHAYGLGEFLLNHKKWLGLDKPFRAPDVSIVLGKLCRRDAELIDSKSIKEIPYGADIIVEKGPYSSTKRMGRILFVGLHIEDKGILEILDTAKLLKERGAEFSLHTVGPWKNNAIRNTFETKRSQYGLEDYVICRGELTGSALWQEYLESDIFFFPTFFEFETFGLVVLEAMAYGLPVVSSNWRGPGDVVEDGASGFIVPVHDPEGYADAIEKLLNDPEMMMRMGAYGRLLYKERYSKERFINAVQRVVEELG